MGKKRREKKKVPEDTPLEKIEYFSMKMGELKKFAVKVGNQIEAVRRERYDFETDRDNMMHYWSNAVYQLMKVERDVRRLERDMIHKKNTIERSLIQKQYDLVDARYDSMTKLMKVSDGSVMRTFDRIRDVIKTEREVFSDRLRARNEHWNTNMTSDIAIMKMKQRARCKEMDKIILVHKDALLETVDERNKIFDGLYDRMEAEAEEKFRNIILLKNKKIHDMRKEHENNIEEIQRNFDDFRNNDLVINLRKQIMEAKEESSSIGLEAEKISTTYSKCLTSYTIVEEILNDLKTLEPSFCELEGMVKKSKEEFKELDEKYTGLHLEVGELENCLEVNKKNKKDLWKNCYQVIAKARQKQIKTHLAMQSLTRMLSEELVLKEELMERYHKKKGRNFMALFDIFNRFHSCRLSLQEILDRTLRSCGSNFDSMGFLPPANFLVPPPRRRTLPPLPPLPRAPARRPRLEWAFEKFLLKPPFLRKHSDGSGHCRKKSD